MNYTSYVDTNSGDYREGLRDAHTKSQPDMWRDRANDVSYFGGYDEGVKDEERRKEERLEEEENDRREYQRHQESAWEDNMSEKLEGTFDIDLAKVAQRKYQDEHNSPSFAPSSGVRWKCHQNIYSKIVDKERGWETGISVEEAGRTLVTGCPHCHRSYCD